MLKATENFKGVNCGMCKFYPNKVVSQKGAEMLHQEMCTFWGSEETLEERPAAVEPAVGTEAGLRT